MPASTSASEAKRPSEEIQQVWMQFHTDSQELAMLSYKYMLGYALADVHLAQVSKLQWDIVPSSLERLKNTLKKADHCSLLCNSITVIIPGITTKEQLQDILESNTTMLLPRLSAVYQVICGNHSVRVPAFPRI